jgi:hypothetical protein
MGCKGDLVGTPHFVQKNKQCLWAFMMLLWIACFCHVFASNFCWGWWRGVYFVLPTFRCRFLIHNTHLLPCYTSQVIGMHWLHGYSYSDTRPCIGPLRPVTPLMCVGYRSMMYYGLGVHATCRCDIGNEVLLCLRRTQPVISFVLHGLKWSLASDNHQRAEVASVER